MSIQSIDGKSNPALQWLGTTGASDSSVARPNRAADSSQLGQSFENLVKEYQSEFGAALTNGIASGATTGSAVGSQGAAPSGRNASAADDSPANQTPLSPSIIGRTAVDAARAATSSPATPAQSAPPASLASNDNPPSSPPVPGISATNPEQMCTLAQAQSVQAAFPNSTLEVWTDSGPMPASSMSGVSPDQPLPYVIAFGTNPSTGGPNLYYAGVIVNDGQQALQQTTQGLMTEGDYYVWDSTPDAQGVLGVTDAGSSFAQFAQYYANQLMQGNAVNPNVYMPNV